MDIQQFDVVIRLLFGAIVLLAGRNIFWLFVALAGFLVGIEAASVWFVDQSAWVTILVAVGMGALGAILAIVLRRVAFSVAGFYAAAFLAIAVHKEMAPAVINPYIILVAGLGGAILSAIAMDMAIIILSAMAGAAAIVQVFALSTTSSSILFVVLATVGVIVQYGVMSRRSSH